MSLCRSRLITCVAVSSGSWLIGDRASASVVLTAASGPAALFSGSTSKSVNFTSEGDYAWVYYAGTGGNTPASPAFQKGAVPAAFSPLVGLTATGTSTVGSSRTGNTASGVTAAVTTTDAASANLTNLPGYTYVSASNSAIGVGMQSTYTMPAGAVQTLSVYCYTLSGVYGRLHLTDDDGGGDVTSLYDDGSSGVQLPASIAQPTKGGGVYRFNLENNDSVPHVLTFAYTIAGYPAGATSGQIGFEGMTASAVPEPAGATVMGVAGLALLGRRRRSSSLRNVHIGGVSHAC